MSVPHNPAAKAAVVVATPKAQHVAFAPEATKHVDAKLAVKAAPAKPVEAKAAVQGPKAAPAKPVEAKAATHAPIAAPAKPVEAKAAVQAPKAAPAKPVEAKAAVQPVGKVTQAALPKPAAATPKAADIQKEPENKVAVMPRKALPQAVSTKTSPFASVEDQFRAAFAAFKVC